MANLERVLRTIAAGPSPQLTAPAKSALLATAQSGQVDGLAELAAQHRVAPWVSAVLSSDLALCHDPRFEDLRCAAAAQTTRTLGLFGELSRLLSALNERDIDVIVLKGPALANQFYPEPGLRPYGDIDVLVHERDLPCVSALLQAWGYRDKNEAEPHSRLHQCHGIFQRIFLHPGGHIVEVHCDHLQIGLEPVGMDAIWERSVDMRFGRGSARVLELHDLFLQLCVHLQRHGFDRLIWFKDLDLMVRSGELDWQRIASDARAQGCPGIVGYALHLLRLVLGTPLPPEAGALIGAEPRVARFLREQAWPASRVVSLQPDRPGRMRRAIQFAPESGVLRGGVPSLFFTGRRRDKARVMASALTRRVTR